MAQKRYWLCWLALAVCSLSAWGQSALQREADKAMRDLDYVTAIKYYNQLLEREKDNVEAKINLADCLRQLNDTQGAERWYAEIVRSKGAKPVHQLYYGMMLQANGKCDKAKAWFEQYAAAKPEDERGQHLLKACATQDALSKAGEGIYVVRNLPINSEMADFGPTIWRGRLIFSSERNKGGAAQRTNMYTGNPFADLYAVPFDPQQRHPADFGFGETKLFGNRLNSKYHEASVAFSADGQTLFLTRNSYLHGKVGRSESGLLKLKIYAGSADENEAANTLQELPFCSNEYNTAHPSVSPDGKRLYFSSNKPGGYGGMDLYVSEWEGGRWGMPINLGPELNTEGNEVFPFIASDGRLYFSSNSHVGLGGLDIYYALPKGKGEWNTPINLGAPINSNRDDFGIAFSTDGKWGVFSSDRVGGKGGDDLYGFTKDAATVEFTLLDATKRQPLKGVSVTNQNTGFSLVTGQEGKVAFDMRPGECAVFATERKLYEPITQEVCANAEPNGQTIVQTWALEKKADFLLQGILFDDGDGLPVEGVTVQLLNDCGRPAETAQTGADGRFRFSLGKKCCYYLQATHEGYLLERSEQYCTDTIAAGQVLRAELTLRAGTGAQTLRNAGEDKNRKVLQLPESSGWVRSQRGEGYVVNVYYDSEQAYIRQESKPDLERLLGVLKDNPNVQIEISSHTDARGDDAYNLQLSQQRANAVAEWLVRNSIARARIKTQGYGERYPVNHCTNGVPCSEEQHQQNRRTEFLLLRGE